MEMTQEWSGHTGLQSEMDSHHGRKRQAKQMDIGK
jgi:hypothetical protein